MTQLFERVCFRTGTTLGLGCTQEEADLNALAGGARRLIVHGGGNTEVFYCSEEVCGNLQIVVGRVDDPLPMMEGFETLCVTVDPAGTEEITDETLQFQAYWITTMLVGGHMAAPVLMMAEQSLNVAGLLTNPQFAVDVMESEPFDDGAHTDLADVANALASNADVDIVPLEAGFNAFQAREQTSAASLKE